MNTSLAWIKAYVPELDVTAQEYTDGMTLSGTKVEGYECLDKNLEKIVVGHILKIDRKFSGSRRASIHDGGPLPEDGIRIKKGKLRGVESNGMMCSIEELGSSREMYPDAPESGIYILPETSVPGSDAVALLGLHDVNFEYEITSNRVDCYSVIGIAREAAATFRKPFHPPVVTETGNDEDINDYLKVRVEDGDLCPRYCARMVKNIKLAPSPEWMKRRLAASGIRPINNIVDITNYVMEEYGRRRVPDPGRPDPQAGPGRADDQ